MKTARRPHATPLRDLPHDALAARTYALVAQAEDATAATRQELLAALAEQLAEVNWRLEHDPVAR